nr:hypothetical protein [uncultured Prevotella sp.]
MRDTGEGFIRDAPQYFEIKESGEKGCSCSLAIIDCLTCRNGFTGPKKQEFVVSRKKTATFEKETADFLETIPRSF